MGSVYRARDLHFPNVEKTVAVKEMINQVHDQLMRETIVSNFQREANILATLNHPGIPRIYDFFTQDERSYLILEFIEGKDLETILSDSQDFFPENQVIAWAVELCDVLSYLHNHKPEPIIFRDMKPSNIMINQYNHIVLVDFGIAKPFQSGPKGTMIGTEGYSPPEQYRGEATPLVDIYALGATMHHVLTRRDPRLEAPFSFGERPIRQINPRVSLELETVIYTAVHYNSENRFQSAQAMKEALLAAAHKTGALSSNPNIGVSRSRETTKMLWNFECEDEVRGTPVVINDTLYIGSYDNNLYALNAATGDFVWKYAADGGIVSKPVLIENNLVFGSEDFRLHCLYQPSGKLIWTYYTDGPIRSSPSVAEGHIFIGSDDRHIHAINGIHGRRAWRVDTGAPVRSTPIVINDKIYFGSENGDFFCVDLGGTTKWRFKAKRAITSTPAYADGVLYFGSVDSTVYALDANTGWGVWRYRLGKASISSPWLENNMLFIGSTDGCVYAIDINSAKELWRYETEHQVNGSPVVYKDSLYFGSIDGYIYCLEYRTGRLRWKFRTEAPITGSPTAAKDMVYIGSLDHRVYALAA